MTKDEALDLALEALLWANIEINDWRDDAHGYKPEDQPQIMKAITAIKQARSAPVQEPVAWNTGVPSLYPEMKDGETISVEYTTPLAAQRQWVGLTDEELSDIYNQTDWNVNENWDYERAIEAKLKEKNGGVV